MAITPDNQEVIITEGERRGYLKTIAELTEKLASATAASDTSAIARELDVANMNDIADLTAANAALTAKNAELQAEIDAIRAAMK